MTIKLIFTRYIDVLLPQLKYIILTPVREINDCDISTYGGIYMFPTTKQAYWHIYIYLYINDFKGSL